MTARTTASAQRGAQPPVRLVFDIIDKRAADLGAASEKARAELFGLSQGTLSRLRRGLMCPSLNSTMRIAQILDVKVEEIAVRDGAEDRSCNR